MKFQKQGPYLAFSKPVGFSSHAPSERIPGLVEIANTRLNLQLKLGHRIDKETSGILVMAETTEAAAALAEQFETKGVQKKYLFVTDRAPKQKQLTYSSHIKKVGEEFRSFKNLTPNSSTELTLIKSHKNLSLWEAKPLTGKPHQIRLHAQDLDMSILGDPEHGGNVFFRMMLHSQSIKFSVQGEDFFFEAPPPNYFLELSHLEEPEKCLVQTEMYRRDFFELGDSFRITHNGFENMNCDKLGEVLWVNWYKEDRPTHKELDTIAAIQSASHTKHIHVAWMTDKGANPQAKKISSQAAAPDSWKITENGAHFEMRSQTGTSAGLFLDQRPQRKWVRENSKEKKVLNLFSYTGGFSVNAALGGASDVVSVDLSPNYNEWAKTNFSLNSLDPTKYEFWSADTQVFLKGADKKNRTFDIVICDPPSFARHKNGVFSVEHDLKTLVQGCNSVLRAGGVLLFSTNFEKWNYEIIESKLVSYLSGYSLISGNDPDWDFELPGQEPLLKVFLLQKMA